MHAWNGIESSTIKWYFTSARVVKCGKIWVSNERIIGSAILSRKFIGMAKTVICVTCWILIIGWELMKSIVLINKTSKRRIMCQYRHFLANHSVIPYPYTTLYIWIICIWFIRLSSRFNSRTPRVRATKFVGKKMLQNFLHNYGNMLRGCWGDKHMQIHLLQAVALESCSIAKNLAHYAHFQSASSQSLYSRSSPEEKKKAHKCAQILTAWIGYIKLIHWFITLIPFTW